MPRPASPLLEHQERVRRRVEEGDRRLLLYHGLGTGKTRAAIAAAETLGGPYLAAVPASLRPNFRKEVARWAKRPENAEVLSQTALARGAAPAYAPETVVVDEAHRLRNPSTQTTRSVAALADRAPNLLLLTGSPIVNAPGDLAAPLSMLTGRKLDPESFERRFVRTEHVHPGLLGSLMGVSTGEVRSIADEATLRRWLQGHVDYQPPRLPEGVSVRENRIEVETSPAQRAFVDLMWNRLPWYVRWKLRRDFPLSKTELRNLQAFLTGPREAGLSTLPFRADKDPASAFQESPKLREAHSRLRKALATRGAKALVFSNFVGAGLTPYAAALERDKVPHRIFHGGLSDAQRAQAVADYNAGRARVLLIGPSGGEGISTKGTRLIQVLDPHFHETRSGQAVGRGLRFDSHMDLPDDAKNVAIERYVAKNPRPGWFARNLLGRKADPTADEILERMARRKQELNEEFLALLREVGTQPARPATSG